MAEKLGRTAGAVEQRAAIVGATFERTKAAWTVAERQRVHQLHAQGLTRAQIAERVGRSYLAIKFILQGTGVAADAPGRPWTREDEDRVIQLKHEGLSRAQIAERVSRTPAGITQMLGRRGQSWPRGRQRHRRSEVAAVPPIDITVDREGRLAQLERQIQRVKVGRGHRWRLEGYTLPTTEQWVERLSDPELLGSIIHDVVLEARVADAPPQPSGRRSHEFSRVSRDDVTKYLPGKFVSLLLDGGSSE